MDSDGKGKYIEDLAYHLKEEEIFYLGIRLNFF
jgi:hypothetical protein